MDQFAVSCSATDMWALIRLRGEIDITAAPCAAEALHASVRDVAPPTMVVLDLAGVTFLAVAGARAIVAFADSCAQRGLETRLVSDPDGIVTRVLRLTGLQTELPVYGTLTSALPPEAGLPTHT